VGEWCWEWVGIGRMIGMIMSIENSVKVVELRFILMSTAGA
jgi:hypothetical protein